MSKSTKPPSPDDQVVAQTQYTDGFKDLVDRYDGCVPPDPGMMPDVLYHYTNAGGLHGMLSSNSIWLTHYRYLNDTSEVQHTDSVIREVLSGALETKGSEIPSKILAKLVEKSSLSADFDIYIFSLSEQRDSLSQWRGYASEGRGFTMGLETRELVKNSKKKVADGGFDIFRVEYDKEKQIKVLSNALSDIIDRAEENIATGMNAADAIDNAVWSFQFVSLTRSVSNKHSSFKDESEWRICLFDDKPPDNDLSKKNSANVRVRGSDLIPYLVVRPGLKGKFPLKSVGVGPGFSRANQTDAVRALCRSLGYEPEVYNADTPYTRE